MTVARRGARARLAAALAAAALAAAPACDGDVDPCASVTGTCLAIHVAAAEPDAVDPIDQLDQLELDILYGDRHATTTVQADGGRVVALPVATSIAVDVAAGDELTVGVVVAAKLAGTIRGTGAASATVAAGDHAALELRVAPPVACVAGGLYCGGDKLAGDPDTLYQCNAGGVPLARGACAAGCVVTPTEDDVCRAAGGPCVEGGFYCGGDKLAGDPQALYRCVGGVGTAPQVCADGCVVRPGQDDACR